MKLNKLIFAAAALLVLGCGKKGTEDVLVPEKGSYTGTVTVVYQGSDFDNENIKFSVLIGSPNLCAVRIGDFSGILEYVWEWPSEKYPDNYRIQAPKELIEEEYYSRFMKGLWVVPDRTEEEVAVAAIAAGKARFEFGEKPDV